METGLDVVSLGILVADVLCRPVEQLPPKGKIDFVDQIELHLGGLAAATGTVLAKLAARVAVGGKVGDDGFGEFLVRTMRDAGVDTTGIVCDPATNTSSTVVLVSSDGERTFLHYVGASSAMKESEINHNIIRKAKVLHYGGTFLMAHLDGEPIASVFRRAKRAGAITSLDTAWDGTGRWMAALEPSLPHLDYLFSSLEEARQITGADTPEEIAEVYSNHGVKTPVIKMGRQGCYLKRGDREHRLAAHRVNVVDTTGAGDAFVGGFLYGVVKEWDLLETLQFANAVGGITVTQIGGAEAVRSTQATIEFMEQQPAEIIK